MLKCGDHVMADNGDGPVIAHVANHEADGDGKHLIQLPNGNTVKLAHREPADRDDKGSGGTFWNI